MNPLAQISSTASDAPAASAILFYVFALLSTGSAVCVVASKNIVRTAVALLFTLVGVAGLYFLLSAEFLAAVQLVVYAGGTLILIVFGVMLTSKSPFSRFEPKLGEVIVALSLGTVLLVSLISALMSTHFAQQPIQTTEYPIEQLGQSLLGDYLVAFEIISVLLLVVMIGAAYLAKGRRREEENGSSSPPREDLTPSPGTPGEGRGEGDLDRRAPLKTPNHPHPNPLPEYRQRGSGAGSAAQLEPQTK